LYRRGFEIVPVQVFMATAAMTHGSAETTAPSPGKRKPREPEKRRPRGAPDLEELVREMATVVADELARP
jgi:hypothetical protein